MCLNWLNECLVGAVPSCWLHGGLCTTGFRTFPNVGIATWNYNSLVKVVSRAPDRSLVSAIRPKPSVTPFRPALSSPLHLHTIKPDHLLFPFLYPLLTYIFVSNLAVLSISDKRRIKESMKKRQYVSSLHQFWRSFDLG